MKHLSIAVIALALGLVLARGDNAANAQGDDAPKKGAFPILICDFAKCVDKTEEARDMFEEWQKQREKTEKDLKSRATELQKRIEEIKKQTKLSERDDKLYERLKTAIEDKGKLEGEIAYLNVKSQDYFARRMQELMWGAKSTANSIMKKRGAQLVIGTKTGKILLESQQDLQEEMLRRRVLCYEADADITQAVMDALNKDYAARKAAKKGAKKPAKKPAGKDG